MTQSADLPLPRVPGLENVGRDVMTGVLPLPRRQDLQPKIEEEVINKSSMTPQERVVHNLKKLQGSPITSVGGQYDIAGKK